MSPRPSFDSGFSTTALSTLYSPESMVSALLRFEEALVLALADAGIAPEAEAEAVANACRAGVTDPEGVLASTWESGTPIIALREAVAGGEWFHHGATTQDAVDTAQMLLSKSALEILEEQLGGLARRLRHLTEAHRHQPQMGRTFLQSARPTTFGFRTATWLDAVLAHITELGGQRGRLTAQLGGAVGTAEQYGSASREVTESLARRLGLSPPEISWHSDRTRILALAQAVERSARTMAKIGSDVALLASSPIAEVTVRSGRSSSMPEKQNPVDSVRTVAAASACSGAVGMLTNAPPHELDRAVGSWHVEWLALPLVFQTAAASVEGMGTCIQSLEVDAETMTAQAGGDAKVDQRQIDRVLGRFDSLLPS